MLYRPMSRLHSYPRRIWLHLPATMQQFVRYASVGLINMALFYGLFNILLAVGWTTLAAYMVSFSIVILNSFLWNKFWAFGDRNHSRITHQFALFVVWSIITLGLGTGAVSILLIPLERYGTLGRNLAAILVAPVTVAANFIVYHRWTFARPAAKGQ